jgi:hypothetical protein
LPTGDVDREIDVGKAGVEPAACLAASGRQYPIADWHDEAGMLGKANELLRADLPIFWVEPTE